MLKERKYTMSPEIGQVHSSNSPWETGTNNQTTPRETELEKLKKTPLFDYANAMQAGAYQG